MDHAEAHIDADTRKQIKSRDESLTSDESYLVMKVIIVKEVMTCDVSPVAMFLLLVIHFNKSNAVSHYKM